MKNIALARAEDMPGIFEKIKAFIPDDALASITTAMFFELQPLCGVVWLTDLIIGRRATIHIVIWDDAWRHKSRELQLALLEAFQIFQLKRLSALIPSDNQAACRLAEKVGFSLEGVLRKAASFHGELVDLSAYSILKEDFHGLS
jgi:RimJ/RimL family protein N-acetyltransferase